MAMKAFGCFLFTFFFFCIVGEGSTGLQALHIMGQGVFGKQA